MLKIKIEKPNKNEIDAMGVNKWGIWECEPSTFDWEYNDKETCYFLEGKVVIKALTGTTEISKGDLAVFPKGLKCTWNVIEKVRKFYKFG